MDFAYYYWMDRGGGKSRISSALRHSGSRGHRDGRRLTIPLMKRTGFNPPLPALLKPASQVARSCPGQGAAAFVMADFWESPTSPSVFCDDPCLIILLLCPSGSWLGGWGLKGFPRRTSLIEECLCRPGICSFHWVLLFI
jgi:hypothetical protein